MDINEYLEHGTSVPNPNYKKPTKKSPGTPKFIQSDSLDDANKGVASKLYNSMADDKIGYKSVTDVVNRINSGETYNIALANNQTEADINRIKAEKQSALTQASYFLGQAVGNEAILGTFLSFSNIADFLMNIGKPKGEDDYTNPLSLYIEGLQDNIRKNLEIHRENPDTSWDFGDTGWWFDNAVSVASSASMLIPSVTLTKGIGLVGKGLNYAAKLNKYTQKAAKATKYVSMAPAKFVNWASQPLTKTDKVGRIHKSLVNGAEIATTATLSRTMENYMEGRETYKQVYDDTLAKISDPSFDREKFFKINPNLLGKSDEEIAKYIASVSADETFANDYAMLLMDIVQFKALKNLWTGKAMQGVSGGMREINRRAAQGFGRGVNSEITKVSLKDRLKYLAAHPGKSLWEGIKSIEFTEGVEEIYQGIQVEKGKEVAERIFNPNYEARTLKNYLSDDAILEQGFWGIIGGWGFKHIANGTNKVGIELSILYNQRFAKEGKKWDDKEIALRRMGYEKAQIEEIKGREALIVKFNQDIKNLRDTTNGPVTSNIQTLKDKNSKDILDQDGNPIYKELTEEERLQEIEDTINKFVTDMTLNAADVGTFELLKEYIKDPEVKKALQESQSGVDIEARLLQKMEDVYNKYHNHLYSIYQSLDDIETNVARQVARGLVYNDLNIETNNNKLNDIIEQIKQINANNDDIDAYLDDKRKKLLTNIYTGITASSRFLDERMRQAEVAYASGEISKQAYEQYKREINIERAAVVEYANQHFINLFSEDERIEIKQLLKDNKLVDFIDRIESNLKQHLVDLNIDQGRAANVPDAVKKLLDEQVNTEYDILRAETAKPRTQQEYQDLYDVNAMNMNLYTAMRWIGASGRLYDWIEQQENLDEAKEALINGKVKEIQADLDILKIGHYSTQQFVSDINKIIEDERKRREKQQQEDEQVTSDGQQQTGESAQQTKNQLDDAENRDNGNVPSTTPVPTPTPTPAPTPIPAPSPTSSSTGQVQQTETTAAVDENYNPTAQTEIDENGQEIEVVVNPDIEAEAINDVNNPDAKAAEEAGANYELTNDALAASMATTTLMDWIRADKSIIDVLKAGYGTNQLNALIDKLADELVVKGVTPSYAKQAAQEGLMSLAKILHKGTNQNEYLSLVQQIALNLNINSRDFAASKPFVGKKDVNQIIEKFIEEWCKKYNIEYTPGTHTVIDTQKLLKDIIEDTNIGIETAKLLIRNLRDYLASNQSKKFIFDNRKIIYGLKSDIGTLINQIRNARAEEINIDNQLHISLPTKPEDNAKAKNAILNQNENSKLTFTRKGNSISIKLDGVEIGYLATVTMDTDGTNVRLNDIRADGRRTIKKGFYHTFTKVNSNNLNAAPSSNLDNFFNALFAHTDSHNKRLWDAIMKFHAMYVARKNGSNNYTPFEQQEFNDVLTNPVIQNLIKNDLLHTIPNNPAYKILKDLHDIIFYDGGGTTQELINSYDNWKRKMYNNYMATKQIQDIKDDGGEISGSIASIRVNMLGYSNTTRTEATEMKIGGGKVNAKRNPIVYYTDSTHCIDDNGNTYPNNGEFRIGGSGILLNVQGGRPFIASIVDTKQVKDTPLHKFIKEELTNIFTEFSSGNITFDEISTRLSNLMGGVIDGKGQGGNHLLAGVRIVQNNGRIGIMINNEVVAMIYRDRKGNGASGTGITHFNTKYPNGKFTFITPDTKAINNIVGELINNLKFNISYIMAQNTNNLNSNINYYFNKRNGKFVVDIAGFHKEYDNYTEFIYDNNIAIVNQKVDANGNVYNDVNVEEVYIEVNGRDTTSLPVEGTTNRSATDIITNATVDKPATGREVAESLGLNEQELDIVTGQEDGIGSLLPKSIIYDAKLVEFAKSSGEHVYISPKGLNEMLSSKQQGLRLLIHERIHQLLDEKNIFARENIIDELIDTFNRALEAARKIKPREPNYKAADTLIKWADKEGYNPKEFKSTLSVNNSMSSERIFAEDWLVDSITQPGFADLLNSIYSEKGEIKDSAIKTLWHRIIEAILKLFNTNHKNINNFSILAEHMNILNNNLATTETVTENVTHTPPSNPAEKPVQPAPAATEQQRKDKDISSIIGDLTIDIDNLNLDTDFNDNENTNNTTDAVNDDTMFASKEFVPTYHIGPQTYRENPMLNPTGLMPFNNTEQFVNQFPEPFRDNIRKAIEDGDIQFACRI